MKKVMRSIVSVDRTCRRKALATSLRSKRTMTRKKL